MEIYEKQIIGGIVRGIVQPSTINLSPLDFKESDLGEMFKAAKKLETDRVPIDADVLISRVSGTDIGFWNATDLRLMAQTVSSASLVYEAVDKIKGASLKTFLLENTAALALDDKKTGAQLLEKLQSLVLDSERFYKTSENNFVFLKDIAEKTIGVLTDFHHNVRYATPTGFAQWDDQLLDGFSKGDEHIIVGMTGNGKSALALNCAFAQAQQGTVVGVVSREMSDLENNLRLASTSSGIPRWKMRCGLDSMTLADLTKTIRADSIMPIAFDTVTDNVETLRPHIRRMVEEHNLGILYVDYLQLMTSNKNAKRSDEVAAVSRGLKLIAMENKIPVVSLCQFNRGAISADRFDIMNHLKESSGIEQDASTISYIQIEKTELEKPIKDAQVTVLKNRNGVTFKPINFDYRGEIFQFTEQVKERTKGDYHDRY